MLGQLQVTGVTGLGGISWDAKDQVLWACAITGTNPSLSNQIGWIKFNSSTQTGEWHHVGDAPHGCTNNLTYANGKLWADGAYKLSNGSSQWIDVGRAVLWTTLTMTPTYHPFTPDGHVSGAIPAMRRVASTPFIPGMFRSITTTSGVSSSTSWTASAPAEASPMT